MLSSFDRAAKSTVSPAPANRLNRRDGKSPVTDDTVWIDLNFPTTDEAEQWPHGLAATELRHCPQDGREPRVRRRICVW